MENILDHLDTELKEYANKTLFKLIAIGLISGIGIQNLFGSIRLFTQSFLLQLDLYGLTNKIIVNLAALVTILCFVKLFFQYFLSDIHNSKYSVNRLLIYAVVILFLSFLLQVLFPFSIEYDNQHIERMDRNVHEIGEFMMLSAALDFIAYLIMVLGSAWLIVHTRTKKMRKPL